MNPLREELDNDHLLAGGDGTSRHSTARPNPRVASPQVVKRDSDEKEHPHDTADRLGD